MKTTMCTGMEEIFRNFKDLGIVYTPPEDGEDHGNLTWDHCWEQARRFSKPHPAYPEDFLRGMEFGSEIPCDIEGDTIYLFVIHDDMQIEDVKDLTTYQAVGKICNFIAGNYWENAIGNYGEND
jgi:hypothetical protein